MRAANLLLPRRSFVLLAVASLLPLVASGSSCAAARQAPMPLFTDTEREAIRGYWNMAGRYTLAPSPDVKDRVNVTIDGSTWYWNYLRAKKPDATTATTWQEWWNKRIVYEKACCSNAPDKPSDPGPPPATLSDLIGSPCPALYEHVSPTRYTVTFAPSDAATPFVYEDGIDFGKRSAYFAYYRSKGGVLRAGKRVKEYIGDDKMRIDALFAKAGRSDFERHVLQAVSVYEGGFEAINTYDTGFVSVGFLQFITGADGTGSLAAVLLQYKTDDPTDFSTDFHRFGIDVTPTPQLVCVDPTTGAELYGADAVRRVIDDKRLTAVFERAGSSDGFRLAQIAVARDRYWPGDDPVTTVPATPPPIAGGIVGGAASPQPPVAAGTDLSVRVSDIFHSEAGIATLMDRKVNKGNLRELPDVVARIMKEKGLTDLHDLARYEHTLIAALKYRGDFLTDPTLTQPPPEPTTDSTEPSTSPSPAPHKRRRR